MMLKNLNAKKLIYFLVGLLILVCLSVLLDIPVLRQLSGFIFLTFIPGLLLLFVLKLNRLGLVDKIVLSAGLSIAFVMLFGLVVNFLSLAIGYTKPLTTIPLLISFVVITVILAGIAYIRNRDISLSLSVMKLSTREKLLLVVPALFPLLSIIGIRMLNQTDNNVIILLLLCLIPVYVIFISFYSSKVPERFYTMPIFLISLSLILLQTLRSNHIVGSDVHQMYYVFQNTLDKMHYSIETPSLVSSLASITIFPAIYQAFLKINPEHLFKFLFPLLCSVAPLVVYLIAKKYIGGFYAFLTSFLFASQIIFFRTTDFASTNMAILLFATAVMVLFHDGISEFGRRLFFLILCAACVISHYSTSIIFFFILVLTWIGMQLLKRVYLRSKRKQPLSGTAQGNPDSESSLNNPNPSANDIENYKSTNNSSRRAAFSTSISVTTILLLFVLLFFWYSQITQYPFNIAIQVINNALINLQQSFALESKSIEVSAALGQMIAPTVWKVVRLTIYWLEIILIAIGGLSIAARYRKTVTYPDSGNTLMNPLKSRFELEYIALSASCVIIIAGAVILPYISIAYTLWRSYFQALVFLSVFFAIGAVFISRWLRIRAYQIMLLILVPYFLFSCGLVEYAYGIPTELWLNTTGSAYQKWYIHDEDSSAAKWVVENRQDGVMVYSAGEQSALILTSQAKLPYQETRQQRFTLYQSNEVNGYIYITNNDVVVGEVLDRFADTFVGRNKIYTARNSAIYR